MHDVTERGAERAGAQAALEELLVGALEGGNATPLEVTRIQEHLVALGDLLYPVVEAAHHEGDDRAHLGGVLALGLAALEAALDGLARGDGLCDGEGDRHVDGDAAVGGLFDGLDAHRSGGDLHDDVLSEVVEFLGLVGQGLGGASQARVRLHRETTVAAVLGLEDGFEELGGLEGQLAHDLPADLRLGGVGHFLGELRNAGQPHIATLVDAGVGNGRVAGSTNASEGDGLRQLAGIRGIVPQGGGGVTRGVQKGAGGVLDGHGGKHSFVIAFDFLRRG